MSDDPRGTKPAMPDHAPRISARGPPTGSLRLMNPRGTGHARPHPQDLYQGSSHWQLASDEPSRDEAGPCPTGVLPLAACV